MDYPEKILVEKSKCGDTDSFEKLIIMYEKKIYNIAYRMTGNREDAYDIAQEVCIKIYRSLHTFKENSTFSTWVYKIASNVCIDMMRKKRNVLHINSINSENEEFELTIEDKGKLPDEIVESKETIEDIKECILQLSPDYRIIVVLRDIRGHTYEEIAKILNINVGTVKSRLNRARNLLKDKLKNKEHFKRQTV